MEIFLDAVGEKMLKFCSVNAFTRHFFTSSSTKRVIHRIPPRYTGLSPIPANFTEKHKLDEFPFAYHATDQ